MKILRILVALVVAGAALVFLAFSSTSTFPNVILASHQDIGIIVTPSRKLKENDYNMHSEKMKRDVGNVNLEDYRPLNPAPGSRATIKAGPIEHGTPLNPYIPKPGPPSNPGFTESP